MSVATLLISESIKSKYFIEWRIEL